MPKYKQFDFGLYIVNEFDFNVLILNIAQEQCQESFKKVFDYFSSKLFIFGTKGKLSENQAKDLVQEVMTTVWTKASTFDPTKGNAKTWIYTIARNTRYDIYRKSIKDQNTLNSDDIWQHFNEILSDIHLDEKLQNNQLKILIEELPEKQKEVIESIYLDGLTQEEFSANNNVPLGTVKSRIRLALNKLNKVLKS